MVFQRAKMPLSLRLGGIFDLQWVCAYEFRNRYSIHLSYGATLESSVYLTVQFFLDATRRLWALRTVLTLISTHWPTYSWVFQIGTHTCATGIWPDKMRRNRVCSLGVLVLYQKRPAKTMQLRPVARASAPDTALRLPRTDLKAVVALSWVFFMSIAFPAS
jgi:hypothetical protein